MTSLILLKSGPREDRLRAEVPADEGTGISTNPGNTDDQSAGTGISTVQGETDDQSVSTGLSTNPGGTRLRGLGGGKMIAEIAVEDHRQEGLPTLNGDNLICSSGLRWVHLFTWE